MNDKPLPFGGPELLQQARDLCQALEALPPGLDQTKIISLVGDATFGLQQLQATGEHFWPRPVVPTRDMTFGQALEALKAGRCVARAGWNGKGMWLTLVSMGLADPMAFQHVVLRPLPWIGMKTADDCFVPWLASQTDMLAEDWVVVGGADA